MDCIKLAEWKGKIKDRMQKGSLYEGGRPIRVSKKATEITQ